jgi:hypothetical protein
VLALALVLAGASWLGGKAGNSRKGKLQGGRDGEKNKLTRYFLVRCTCVSTLASSTEKGTSTDK